MRALVPLAVLYFLQCFFYCLSYLNITIFFSLLFPSLPSLLLFFSSTHIFLLILIILFFMSFSLISLIIKFFLFFNFFLSFFPFSSFLPSISILFIPLSFSLLPPDHISLVVFFLLILFFSSVFSVNCFSSLSILALISSFYQIFSFIFNCIFIRFVSLLDPLISTFIFLSHLFFSSLNFSPFPLPLYSSLSKCF